MSRVQTSPVVGLSWDVLEWHDAPARPDGIGTYTRELASALAAQGVVVCRIGAPRRSGIRLIRPREATLCFPLPLSYLTAASAILHVATPFTRAIERAITIYHATDYLVPRLSRTPVVATIYDAIPLSNPEWANPRLRAVKNWLLRRCAQSADLVIAISEAAVGELVDHYRLPRDRIRVVPLGVNERWFEHPLEDSIAATLARYRLRRGYILHVGTLQPRKNIDRLIDAYESSPASLRAERQLVVVGKYGWGVESLRSRLQRLSAQGRVVWLDYVDQKDLHALYCGAGMFVFPSLAEGFGMPLLEASACGLPVVASDLPVLREVAEPISTRFTAPDRVEAIADAIIDVHESSSSEADIAARIRHARRFSWAACAAMTLGIYRELSATGRPTTKAPQTSQA